MIADATGSQEETIRAFLRDGVRSALDVGCGTGEKTMRIARQAGETVGIDPDAGHVRKAQARHGSRHLCFLTARAEALCFAEASFDTVFFIDSLHHVPAAHQQAALRESHRVLKPRGRMLVIDPVHGSGALGRTLCLYLEEKEPEQSAVEAIEAVAKSLFALKARLVIRVEYRFAGMETLFDFLRASGPGKGRGKNWRNGIHSRFERCRRNREGQTIIDYDENVWRLTKT